MQMLTCEGDGNEMAWVIESRFGSFDPMYSIETFRWDADGTLHVKTFSTCGDVGQRTTILTSTCSEVSSETEVPPILLASPRLGASGATLESTTLIENADRALLPCRT